MDQTYHEPFGFGCRLFADKVIGVKAFKGLQLSPEVVIADEVGDVLAQLVWVVAVEVYDRRVRNCAVPLPGNGLLANCERDALTSPSFGKTASRIFF